MNTLRKLLLVGLVAVMFMLNTAYAEPVDSGPVYYKDKVITLMYHDMDAKKDGDSTILTSQFEEQIKTIISEGYNFISMEQYIDYMDNGAAVPNNAVLLTFDDGYASFYTEAFPILLKYNIVATNFLIVNFTDLYYPDALPHLTWDQIRIMKDNGMSFFSHTYNQHLYGKANKAGFEKPALASKLFLQKKNRVESLAEYSKRVLTDLTLAEKRLAAELGVQPKVLAFPYGAYNDDVLDLASRIGINHFFTIKEGINTRETKVAFRINAGSPKVKPADLLKTMQKYNDLPGV